MEFFDAGMNCLALAPYWFVILVVTQGLSRILPEGYGAILVLTALHISIGGLASLIGVVFMYDTEYFARVTLWTIVPDRQAHILLLTLTEVAAVILGFVGFDYVKYG